MNEGVLLHGMACDCVCVCSYVCVYMCVCLCLYMSVNVYVCVCVCICMSMCAVSACLARQEPSHAAASNPPSGPPSVEAHG